MTHLNPQPTRPELQANANLFGLDIDRGGEGVAERRPYPLAKANSFHRDVGAFAARPNAGKRGAQLNAMPPIARVSMASRALERNPLRRLWRKSGGRTATKNKKANGRPSVTRNFPAPWRKTARRRRVLL